MELDEATVRAREAGARLAEARRKARRANGDRVAEAEAVAAAAKQEAMEARAERKRLKAAHRTAWRAVPVTDDGARLVLAYEEGTTGYGRATKRAVDVADTETGELLPLRRGEWTLVTRWPGREGANGLDGPEGTAANGTDCLHRFSVTVMAIGPRRGTEAPANEDTEAPEDGTARLSVPFSPADGSVLFPPVAHECCRAHCSRPADTAPHSSVHRRHVPDF